MSGKKLTCFLPLLLVVLLCGGAEKKKGTPCTKETCLNDADCLCWCSQICHFRKKTASDSPVYVENDPNGKFCYCKQWDVDHYEDNCLQHKHIKEPAQ